MPNGITPTPQPINEPILNYAPGAPEKITLKKRLHTMLAEEVEIPLLIGGREVRTGNLRRVICPHDHGHTLAHIHQAGPAEIQHAIEAARKAWYDWSEMEWEARAAVFLKAADLLAGPWRDTLNAATMLNQSKTVFQAEIDAACELIDFWRFNPYYMRQIYAEQPASSPGVWNYAEYRPLEGFVFAVSPFNFTSIAGNLPTAPAMMGNVVLWKPAAAAVLSGYYLMKVFAAAGLPDGVINFISGPSGQIGDVALESPQLAGFHFTGSTEVFQHLWRGIGKRIETYATYPRIVGETGGKDFIFAHASAEPAALVTAMVRGAFEYQGQKCSAASRTYVPKSLWPAVKEEMGQQLAELTMGSPMDFRNFMAAVIEESAFHKISGYIEEARASEDYEILFGGGADGSTGYFIEPTVVLSHDPKSKLMCEEIFGPVLTVFVYPDAELDQALDLCDTSSPYGLTGAIFAQDRQAIVAMSQALRHTSGNFYVNDKPTGAVVGQQPFGGGRASGTNDKAGSMMNLLRWTSQRSVKENFLPPRHSAYPHMGEE